MITYDDELLYRAISRYGCPTQILVAVEELSELQKELLKDVNRNKTDLNHIKEEIADVYIMLMQLIIIYGFNDVDINEAIHEKQERLRGRLNEKM